LWFFWYQRFCTGVLNYHSAALPVRLTVACPLKAARLQYERTPAAASCTERGKRGLENARFTRIANLRLRDWKIISIKPLHSSPPLACASCDQELPWRLLNLFLTMYCTKSVHRLDRQSMLDKDAKSLGRRRYLPLILWAKASAFYFSYGLSPLESYSSRRLHVKKSWYCIRHPTSDIRIACHCPAFWFSSLPAALRSFLSRVEF